MTLERFDEGGNLPGASVIRSIKIQYGGRVLHMKWRVKERYPEEVLSRVSILKQPTIFRVEIGIEEGGSACGEIQIEQRPYLMMHGYGNRKGESCAREQDLKTGDRLTRPVEQPGKKDHGRRTYRSQPLHRWGRDNHKKHRHPGDGYKQKQIPALYSLFL